MEIFLRKINRVLRLFVEEVIIKAIKRMKSWKHHAKGTYFVLFCMVFFLFYSLRLCLKIDGGRILKANDVANYLDIKLSTLRKYALLFESSGYVFERDAQNSRVYNQQDIKLLTDFITIKKGKSKLTNEEVLEKLGYRHTNSKLTGNCLDKDDQQQLIEIMDEVKLLEQKMEGLDKKVEGIQDSLFGIAKFLSKNLTSARKEEISEQNPNKVKKKSIWGLIKSHD